MAYDSVRHRVVLYGGEVNSSDTWEYDGNNWTQIVTAQRPPTIMGGSSDWYQAAAFDTVRNRVVLVDSKPNTGTQTWEWDGASWTQVNTGGPSGRRRFSVAFDSLRGVLVLFGGHGSASNVPDSQTWEWNGVQWQQRGSGGPQPRSSHQLAYDSIRHVTVLFGGEGNTARYGDTWEWDGVSWREYFGVPGPQPRTGHQMAFDSVRGRCVMFGGTNLQSAYYNDTREWDGIQWTQPTPTSSPASCQWRSMVFDSARNVCVLYVSGVTHEYSVTTPVIASYSSFGNGCSGPSGTPVLSANAGSTPRLGTTLHLQVTGIPASLFTVPFGAFGFSNTAWGSYSLPLDLTILGMPGCTAWISPDISETLVNAGGTANWDIVIPNQIHLLNVNFYTQCVATVPSVNPASLIVSNAGHGVIGTQ